MSDPRSNISIIDELTEEYVVYGDASVVGSQGLGAMGL